MPFYTCYPTVDTCMVPSSVTFDDFLTGWNITITPDDGTNTITIAATGVGTGDITGVAAQNGLTGGGASGYVALNVGAGDGIDVTTDVVAVDVTDLV